jgi:hypothetical protein
MKTKPNKNPAEDQSISPDWKRLYLFAAIAAILVVLVGVLDIALSMRVSEAQENSTVSIIQWFTLFQNNAFESFRQLGLFNIINLLLAVPLYLALHHLHRETQPAFSSLSVLLFSIGTAIYISSNSAFPLFAISRQYAAAPEAQKAALELIGQAALAQGADLTPGTFMGFILTELAGMLMAFVLLQGGLFGKVTAWVGMLGLGVLAIFNVMVAFTPELFNVAMSIAMLGGPLSMVFYILLARRLFQLAKA